MRPLAGLLALLTPVFAAQFAQVFPHVFGLLLTPMTCFIQRSKACRQGREPGALADRRPEIQRMIDAAATKPPAFDAIVAHSFSRLLRDQLRLEFYVRRLANSGVRLVSITQDVGDDPMSNMIRQTMALFHEYPF